MDLPVMGSRQALQSPRLDGTASPPCGRDWDRALSGSRGRDCDLTWGSRDRDCERIVSGSRGRDCDRFLSGLPGPERERSRLRSGDGHRGEGGP